MKRNIIDQYYKNRGLSDYQLQNIEDILFVHGINVLETAGYENLTENNKMLFKTFLVNFFNACGLEARSTIIPVNINYVLDVECLGKENKEDDYYVTLIHEIIIEKADNTTKLLKEYENEIYKHLPCIETCKKRYLRFDYIIYDREEWQHVITPTEWY